MSAVSAAGVSAWWPATIRYPLSAIRLPMQVSPQAATHDLGNRHRPRDPRAARDAQQDLLEFRHGLRRRAQHAGEPRRPRLPGRAAGAERRGRPDGRALRARDRREDLAPLDFRAQELLLPGPAEGLPDQPVRAPGGRGRLARDRARRRHAQDDRHHPRPPRGGRGQVAARGFPRPVGHRPEPRRHAAARDRLRARPSLREGSRRVHEEDPHAGALPRDLRRQHAGRLVPLRRQRLGAAEGPGRVRHARRDQEPELVPLRRARDQLRDRAPDRPDRGRRQGGPGDAPVRPGPRRDALDALQGRGERLPLLPGSRPAAARDRRGDDRGGARHACRSCRTRRRRVSPATTACPSTTPAC